MKIMKSIILPSASTLDDDHWWKTICVLLIVPLTAILHHVVFFTTTCMIDNFGPEYTPTVVWKWLSRDPSLPWAIVASWVAYRMGNRSKWVRAAVAPVFVAFLPLSLWLWDIPFAGRPICNYYHDGLAILYGDSPLRSIHFYVLGACIYALIMVRLLIGLKFPSRRSSNAGG